MYKSFILTVEVGYKVLGTLGQIQDSLKINYFGRRRTDIGKGIGEQFEHTAVDLYLLGCEIGYGG